MDSGSPISLDFSFPFNDSPQATVENGDNISMSDSHRITGRDITRSGNSTTGARPRNYVPRSSIDSMLEQDVPGQWQQNAPHSIQRTTSSVSFSADVLQDKGQGDDERLPSWSELKTKAGKERKRLPLACIACRRKKIKCSGEKPACKHCLRARVPCVYKVTTRKAAPRTDYMAMLDKRLKRMEDRVIKMIPKEDLPDLAVTGRASVRPPIPGQQTPKDKDKEKEKLTAPNKRSAEEAFDTELNEWKQPRRPVNILDRAARNKDRREAENRLFTEGAEALPPTHIQQHLAEIFFDCVYGQSYLLLHKPSFMRKLKAGSVPPVLTLAVCAVSARFSTHPQVNSEPAFLRGEQWATPARIIAEKRHFEPNITVLTVMLILGLHYFGTCEGGLSWSFGGQAMRMGYALQLHRELDHDPLGQAQAERAVASGKPSPQIQELSFTDREIRRRLMWACYLMDTFNSSGTERPSFLNEDYMKIQLPIRESHFQLEMPGLTEDIAGHIPLTADISINAEQTQAEAKANMGVAAYAVRAVVIWKRIVQYLNLGGKEKDAYPIWDPLSQFASLQRQISTLEATLPESLKYNPDNLAQHITKRLANQFLFLHIVIAQTNLFLHRFAIPTAPNVHRPYPPNTPKSFLASSAATVVEAAGQVSRIVADSTGHTLTVPFAGYCAYASATVHVWGVFSRNASLETTSKDNLRHNYRYLTRMKRYWGMFHYMAESVKDIYRAFADAASQRMQIMDQQQLVTGDTKTVIDSISISAEASREATPTPGGDGQSSTQGEGDTPSDPTRSPKARSKSGSSKAMFQYGDWFDKYPHGVSETEWETSHLPHRKELQKGTEAVMSQQPELQSVEEFFASLSPGAKGDADGMAGGNRRKMAKKRGKSLGESAAATTSPSTSTSSASAARARDMQIHIQQRNMTGQQQPIQTPPISTQKQIGSGQQPSLAHRHSASTVPSVASDMITSASDIEIPMSDFAAHQPKGLHSQPGSAFEMPQPDSSMSSNLFLDPIFSGIPGNIGTPMIQQQPTQHRSPYFNIESPPSMLNSASVAGGKQPQPSQQQAHNPPNFGYNNFTTALPHLDRSMVMGAYAGIDPSESNNSSALNNPNNLEFWNNPWDSIDIDGFTGFNDQYAAPNNGAVNVAHGMSGGVGGNLQQTAAATGGLNSSAWFMPFNIDPPDYGMDDLTFGGLDAMDMGGDNSNTANRGNQNGGSFSGLSSPRS